MDWFIARGGMAVLSFLMAKPAIRLVFCRKTGQPSPAEWAAKRIALAARWARRVSQVFRVELETIVSGPIGALTPAVGQTRKGHRLGLRGLAAGAAARCGWCLVGFQLSPVMWA